MPGNTYEMSPFQDPGNDNKGFEPDLEHGITTNHVDPKSTSTINEYPNTESNIDKNETIDDDYDDDDDDEGDWCARAIGRMQSRLTEVITRNRIILKTAFIILLLAGYYAYFSYALYYEFGSEGSWRLLMGTVLGTFILIYYLVSKSRNRNKSEHDLNVQQTATSGCEKFLSCLKKSRFNLILQFLLVAGFVVFLVLDVGRKQPENLISLSGMAFFLITFYIFSYNPSKVKWRPVFWGIAVQIIFALLILRTSFGYQTFKWLGDRITEFLANTNVGSEFVFGQQYEAHMFAFKILPVIIFFSTTVSMLYYLGVMQVFIRLIGKFLAVCLGTSATESINAAANIFLGQTEAPLLIRPFLKDMTNSEIHAVMTGGFATIAGAVMAAYISYGVPPNHLLSASVMSAPAALALSKLFYPETKKTKIRAEEVYKMTKGNEHNLIEAAANGASMSISLVANIAVNLIAFVAMLAFINSTLIWFGDRVGYGELTFQNICSYVFWPVSFLMGVESDDCRIVAELIGIKSFLNEFYAYQQLSKYIQNRNILDEYLANATESNSTSLLTGHWHYVEGGFYLTDTSTLIPGKLLTHRSIVIATYALCGFSNLSSMGIQLGSLGVMAPERKGDLSRLVFRAMLAGNAACFMTACISGLLYEKM